MGNVLDLLICQLSVIEKITTKEKGLAFLQGLVFLAPQPGLEPGTYGLTVRRSTD